MNDYGCTKPPLGATHAYINSGRRIKELAEAIVRSSDEAEHYTGTIEKWSREILMQLEIIRAMVEYEKWERSTIDCRGAE